MTLPCCRHAAGALGPSCLHIQLPALGRFPAIRQARVAIPGPRHAPLREGLGCRAAAPAQSGDSAEPKVGKDAELQDLRSSTNVFGPRGMLMVGFTSSDGAAVEAWLQQMEPGFAGSYCTGPLLDATVRDAVTCGTADGFRREPHAAVHEPLPRLVLLSGMSGEEAVAIAEHWEHFTGTPLPVFATVVEKMWQRQLRDAILDIIKSYASSSGKHKGAAEAAGLREMIRKKLEERNAEAGRRLIGRAPAAAGPIIIEDSSAGNGDEQQCQSDASTSSQQEKHEDALLDQNAVFRQQLAEKAGQRACPGSKGVGRREVEKKNAVKKGFG